MRRALRTAMLLLLAVVCSAHVGSPDAYFRGNAGPYLIDVVVRPPTVVPGLAEVIVHSADTRVASVIVRPVFWRAGSKGAPPGDEAKPDPTQRGTWSGQLWMMQPGAYGVEVQMRGSAGSGVALVPVSAEATAQLVMSPFLRVLLVILGTMLVAGTITAVHAAAGESQLAPGQRMTTHHTRKARRAAIIAVPVLAFILLGGARWWENAAERYRRTLAKPVTTTTTVKDLGGVPTIEQVVTDPSWRTGVPTVMPDHGKMAHMFVIGSEYPFVLAHLHPDMPDRFTMRAVMPPLPPGRYRVYTDVVHESGLQQTLMDSISVPQGIARAGRKRLEPDDSWSANARMRVVTETKRDVEEGGLIMHWAGEYPVRAERPGVLRFIISNMDGNPVVAEPYLGMAGHAVVVREDGKVFVHLHPTGTSSMASVTAFALRSRGDTSATGHFLLDPTMHAGDGTMMMHPDTVRTLDFPYAFPSAGRYRVYVQMRVTGDVHTTAFEVEVRAASVVEKK